MTVRVERTFELSATPEEVWEFIADPALRAGAISVVDSYESTGEGTARWHVRLPIPFVDRTVAVDTRETRREDPEHVEFTGRSRVMRVVGEHHVERTGDGSRLMNRFTVEGEVPGVERYFKRNLDGELDNLEDALREYLGRAP
jgi:carbon monoxide dehydrogenase subunit G